MSLSNFNKMCDAMSGTGSDMLDYIYSSTHIGHCTDAIQTPLGEECPTDLTYISVGRVSYRPDLHLRILNLHPSFLDLHPSFLDLHPSFLDLHPSFLDLHPSFLNLHPSFLDLHPSFLDLHPSFLDLHPSFTYIPVS